MSRPSVVPGPLAGLEPGFTAHLVTRGYARSSVRVYARGLRHLSRWLADQQLAAADLTPLVMDAFAHEARGGTQRPARARPEVLFGYLQACGAVPPPLPPPATPLDHLLTAYRRWLTEERRLAPLTIKGYLAAARWFLSESGGGKQVEVASLTADDVSGFVLRAAGTRSPRTVNEIVVRLRSLLRFLYARGLIEAPLAQATPWMARATLASLPRRLAVGTTERLLESCDRSLLAGVRDYAVLKLLVRLGLRAGEVAALHLGDIDWARGQMTVRSKGGGRDILPLPVDVGEALAAYLEQRGPAGPIHQVFVHVKAPNGPMTMSDVRAVVREACRRSGVGDTGTHRLRHGVATDMLRAGASLEEIGQLLRHHDLKTTALYAKVDLASLATVAQPWPGGRP